jgi:hypothetical protein
MSEAEEIIAEALKRQEQQAAARVRPDYDALNKMVRRQRGALTRARNSGDPEKVIVACRDAVREWDAPGAMWPDDWATWNNALLEATDYRVRLEDL